MVEGTRTGKMSQFLQYRVDSERRIWLESEPRGRWSFQAQIHSLDVDGEKQEIRVEEGRSLAAWLGKSHVMEFAELADLRLDTSEHAEQLELTLRLRHQNGDTLRLALRIEKLDRLDEARDFFIRLVTPLASRTTGYRSAHKRWRGFREETTPDGIRFQLMAGSGPEMTLLPGVEGQADYEASPDPVDEPAAARPAPLLKLGGAPGFLTLFAIVITGWMVIMGWVASYQASPVAGVGALVGLVVMAWASVLTVQHAKELHPAVSAGVMKAIVLRLLTGFGSWGVVLYFVFFPQKIVWADQDPEIFLGFPASMMAIAWLGGAFSLPPSGRFTKWASRLRDTGLIGVMVLAAMWAGLLPSPPGFVQRGATVPDALGATPEAQAQARIEQGLLLLKAKPPITARHDSGTSGQEYRRAWACAEAFMRDFSPRPPSDAKISVFFFSNKRQLAIKQFEQARSVAPHCDNEGRRCRFSVEGSDVVLVKRDGRWLLKQ